MVYMTNYYTPYQTYESMFGYEPYIPFNRPQKVQSVHMTIHQYVARALYYIDYLIRFLQSLSPYVQKYQPLLEELPKMYHLLKAFQKVNLEASEHHVIEHEQKLTGISQPKLFIEQ